jgi:beta-lactamase superfamily II metal-dependent hydrolase
MDDAVIKRRTAAIGILMLLVVVAWWPEFAGGKFRLFDSAVCDPKLLCVVFLDVGQGDAIFVQSPAGVQLLVDTGRDQSVLRGLGDVMDFADWEINYLLLTHPDADHIGGAVDILERFLVSQVIRTENESDTALWEATKRQIEVESAKVTMARRGQVFDLGGGVKLEILFPDIDPIEMESNTASIVARLIYGDTAFMLTGDSPKSIEEYLVLVEGEHLKSDVLKAGHHGSRTSTAELFLAEVDPKYAVISAGADNSYGHPHVEVTDLLFNYGAETYSTAESGNVVFWSDGNSVTRK